MDYTSMATELFKYQFKLSRRAKRVNSLEHVQGEKMILAYLKEISDGVTPSELARFVNVSTARIASALNSLESKEQIIRKLDKNDRRKINVYITEKGIEKEIMHRSKAVDRLTQLLTALGEHDAKEHIRIMKRIYELTLEFEKEGCNDD